MSSFQPRLNFSGISSPIMLRSGIQFSPSGVSSYSRDELIGLRYHQQAAAVAAAVASYRSGGDSGPLGARSGGREQNREEAAGENRTDVRILGRTEGNDQRGCNLYSRIFSDSSAVSALPTLSDKLNIRLTDQKIASSDYRASRLQNVTSINDHAAPQNLTSTGSHTTSQNVISNDNRRRTDIETASRSKKSSSSLRKDGITSGGYRQAKRAFPLVPPSDAPSTVQNPSLPSLHGPRPQAQTARILSGLAFSQSQLDLVLYGYASAHGAVGMGSSASSRGHAISGIKSSELSYGIEKILQNGVRRSDDAANHDVNAKAAIRNLEQVQPDLPEGLELCRTNFFPGGAHYGVFCSHVIIPRGTRYGPYRGRLVNVNEMKTSDDTNRMWEVRKQQIFNSGGCLSHFVDGRGSSGCWMSFINCARYDHEQNLAAIQIDGEIYYEACRDIRYGTELLVWYGDCYLKSFGIPVTFRPLPSSSPSSLRTPPSTAASLINETPDAVISNIPENEDGYQCQRCGKVFAYKYYRDKHLKYTRCVDQGDRKFPCHLCSRSFEKRDRLRIHILHVHEKHRPHKCTLCSKSFSQSSSLNKHMRVHSGERPYKCVYCSKAFTASSILRTHIRQHSGEKPFKCKHCGKAFASHAAHDSHVRRTHLSDCACACRLCGETFTQACDLKLHICRSPSDQLRKLSPPSFVRGNSRQYLSDISPAESVRGSDITRPTQSVLDDIETHSTNYLGVLADEQIDVVGSYDYRHEKNGENTPLEKSLIFF